MPLTWDVTKVKTAYREISKEEYDALEKQRTLMPNPSYIDKDLSQCYQMNTICNMLIFICGQSIGIPKITQENHVQVFERISFMEKLNGEFLAEINPKTKEKKSLPITLEQVKSHIGLRTNGSVFSKQKFLSFHTKNL
tara:strand:+ start:924 stop:1337 length:414 start_codon:yes stop_codon:yes gene_type:complete